MAKKSSQGRWASGGSPRMRSVCSITWSNGRGGHLGGFVSINSVVCLWVKKNHFFFVIILKNSKSGGDGKPTQSSFQKDVERGRQQENTSENKFIFLAQRQRTGAWSRAPKTDPFKAAPVFHDIQVVIKIPLFTVILMASPLYADR